MKSSEEMVKSLFERRIEYEAEKQIKKKAYSSSTIKAASFCITLVIVLAFIVFPFALFNSDELEPGLMQSEMSHEGIALAVKADPSEYVSAVTGGVYSFSEKPPIGYQYFFPAYDLNAEDWNKYLSTAKEHEEILIQKENETVFSISFDAKMHSALVFEELKEKSELPQGSEDFSILDGNEGWTVSLHNEYMPPKGNELRFLDSQTNYRIIKTVHSEKINYVLYSATNLRSSQNEYYCFVGGFNASIDSGFSIYAYTAQETAEEIFDNINLQLIREY